MVNEIILEDISMTLRSLVKLKKTELIMKAQKMSGENGLKYDRQWLNTVIGEINNA